MEIIISDIHIEVIKKNIKSMNLYVKPPHGKVVITAPKNMSNKTIETFAKGKIDWIKEKVLKYENQPSITERDYRTGETVHIWGEAYVLEFADNKNRNYFEIIDDKIFVEMKGETCMQERESFMKEVYRYLLKVELSELVPKWEEITGLSCYTWQTKYMTTRWGTCNSTKKRLWFNVRLAQKPKICLEYVVLHELTHLVIKNHGKDFKEFVGHYMPNWREIQKLLNS